jgi:hypothetical protein
LKTIAAANRDSPRSEWRGSDNFAGTSLRAVPVFSRKGARAMPRAWTRKDEHQYEHIKESEEKEGTSASRAKEIAARTVNKRRRKEGRTPNKTMQGTGNPNRRLEDRSVAELRNLASELKIEGRSKLNKQGLVREIVKKRGKS